MAIKKTTTKTKAAQAATDEAARDAAAHVEHADHPGGSVTTTDHAAIKAWAESRGGKPAAVASTVSDDDVGLIRIEFPGATNADDSNLTEITWDEFFEKFDEGDLALIYQEQTAAGDTSSFNRFVKRDPAAAPTTKSMTRAAAAKQTAAKRSAAKKTTTVKKTTPTKATTAKKTVGKQSAAKAVAKKGTIMAKTTAKKTTTAKKAPAAKKTAAKKAPAAKKTAAKKAAPAAKKTAAKKATTAKKVPAARGYRGR